MANSCAVDLNGYGLGAYWIHHGASGKITKNAALFVEMDYGHASGDGEGDSVFARVGASVRW